VFYEPGKRNHGLPHDPFKAIVAPRPIGWISTLSARGEVNLAPYSFFNGVSSDPPVVMFAAEGRKDSVVFVEETGQFVCNLATWELREQMNTTAGRYPRGINEMREAGLDAAPSVRVRVPRVAAAPCALECRWLQTLRLDGLAGPATDTHVVFGEVVGVHIDERFLKDGLLDTAALRPIARAGYHDYFVATDAARFSMAPPHLGAAARRGEKDVA